MKSYFDDIISQSDSHGISITLQKTVFSGRYAGIQRHERTVAHGNFKRIFILEQRFSQQSRIEYEKHEYYKNTTAKISNSIIKSDHFIQQYIQGL